MKFLVTFAIFADFFLFLQAISINHIFAKIATKTCEEKNLLRFAILIEFVIFAIVAIFSTHFLTVRLIFFAKITKTICYQIFATVFNPRHKRRATR